MIPVTDLLPAAARAKPALAALRAELGDPSPDVAQALGIIEGIAADIEAGRHPLDRPDDWPERTRWPQWPHWDRMAWAIKTLAAACGARVQCGQKYEYLDIRLGELRDGAAALHDIAELIELASDREGQARPAGTIDGFLGVLVDKTTNAVTLEDMNQIAAAGWAGELETERKGTSMNVADLIAKLQALPPDLPVMLIVSEGGIDYARAVRVADVARHRRDWSFMPIGQYRELPDENTVGEPFQAVVIDLDVREWP